MPPTASEPVERVAACPPAPSQPRQSTWLWCTVTNRAPSTYNRRRPILDSFLGSVRKSLKASELKPYDVEQWASQWDNPTTRGDRISLIKMMLNWGVQQGYLDRSPIANMKKPTPTVRQEFLPHDIWPKLLEATDGEFRDFLTFMLETGCRVTEIRRLRSEWYSDGRFVLPIQESKGCRRSRVIFVPDNLQPMVQKYCDRHPDGVLFRNSKGNAWNKDSINCRMRRLRKKLGLPKLNATMLRHSFAHHRLTLRQDALTVATLMGHVDTNMLARRYGHLIQNLDYLSSAANPPTASPGPTS